MDIKIDDLSGNEVPELLREHLQDLALHCPPESAHALDLEALRKPEITFWSVWEGNQLVGCIALKELDEHHAQIKSMRTVSSHLRKGVARQLLEYIIEESRQRCYRRLSLETGSMDAFEPARRLYANFEFEYCDPFAEYNQDPYSVFMTKVL